jgi:hypothetical protein
MSILAAVAEGDSLGPFEVTVSEAANERYWRAAGVEHPALAAGTLYPPIAANLTILMFQQHCPHAMIQTHQRLRCHRSERAGAPLVVTGRVVARYLKRERDYVDIEAVVHTADQPHEPLWTSNVTFTPAAEL